MDQQSSGQVKSGDISAVLQSLISNAAGNTPSSGQQLLGSLMNKIRDVQSTAQELSKIIEKGDVVSQSAKPQRINVRREKVRAQITDEASAFAALERARLAFNKGEYQEGIDLYEQLTQTISAYEVDLLAELYDQYQRLPQNRYSLYVSRDFDFKVGPNDKVLDIGSGHDPFPFATHLADIAPEDNAYGRAGIPMKYIEGKPFFACSVEDMPFADKEFDFVYCSHVLEHVDDPKRACRELMRVSKRGYIETPSIGKDIWLNTAKISNHHWYVENRAQKLVFTRYPKNLLEGIASNILMSMHCAPQTPREKAFSALVLLKSSVINTTLYWEDEIICEVRE